MRPRTLLAVLLGLAAGLPAQAQPTPGPQPGQGYGDVADPAGHPYVHTLGPDPVGGTMNYAAVPVGTTSTPVLQAAPVMRSKLYLLNASGRPGLVGAAADAWCSYGAPATIGQGFILMGYGDRMTEDVAAVIDPRALNCIASQPLTITVGAVQR